MDDRPPRSLTLLILSGDLEKGLAACNLALATLAGNRRVTLFFSFWGLNFLKRPGAKGAGALSLLDAADEGTVVILSWPVLVAVDLPMIHKIPA